jgi:hypothetical protein
VPRDTLQYVAWVRDAAGHGLISDLFTIGPSPHVFLHPMFLLSGVAARAGVDPALAYLAWTPLAALGLVLGFSAYIRRFLPAHGRWRTSTLLLSLFYCALTAPLAFWAHIGNQRKALVMAQDLFPADRLWGYLPAAMALALVPAFLLALEGVLAGRRRALLIAAASGALAAWFHPWQGELMLILLAAVVAWRRRATDVPRLAIPAIAVALPLLYYFLLAKTNADWRAAQSINARDPGFPVLALLAALAPLGIFAAGGLRRPRGEVGEFLLLAWAPASIVLFLFISPTVPYHALEGLTLPLAVLAARAVRRRPRHARALAALGTAATVVALAALVVDLRDNVDKPNSPVIVSADEGRALDFLAHSPTPGGVLATLRLGGVVPGSTGRQTWVGHRTWTPDASTRAHVAAVLFRGRMPAAEARTVVSRSGARFVLAECGVRAPVRALLSGLADRVNGFGCVALYELRTGA